MARDPAIAYFLMGLGVWTDASFNVDRYATSSSISWSDISSLYLSGISFLLYSFSNPSAIHDRGFRSFSFISSGFIRLPMLSSMGPRFLTDPLPRLCWHRYHSWRPSASLPLA